jgi:3-oxoacyl-[acyl-carrier-protein] synthase II
MGGSSQIEATYEDLFIGGNTRVRPMTVINVMANAAAAHIAIKYGVSGSNLTFANACSSSSVAIGEAVRAIRHGYLDAAIAGGTEALLVYGSLRGWQALGALAPPTGDSAATAACKPFSLDRNGLVLGEGAAVFLLEAEEVALARGADIIAEVAGYGIHSDASHITHPHATGQAHCMNAALSDAGISPTSIDYINAHGTGTRAGDISETQAIKAVFGTSPPPVSSTKAAHGHAIGAAGAIELVACIAALQAQRLPPTLNLHHADAACDLDYVPLEARSAPVGYVMSNSFAFGGSNASLILGQYANR